MRRTILAAAALAIGLFALTGSASASLVQLSEVKLVKTSGTGAPKGKTNVGLDAYLSTRQPDSTRGTKKANPVGSVFMDFPAGSTVNKAAATTCNESEYANPSTLATKCANSVIGVGWALLNTGTATAREQITSVPGSIATPPACAENDATQYTRTWQDNPAAGPDCVPFGHDWVKITLYQGGILKNQWWCFGAAGSPKPGAACNNKQVGGDATGKLYNKFNDTTNASKTNGCNVIFANDNALSPLSFGGSVNQCKNRLTVIVPATNGTGAGLGELPGGYVLSDFYVHTTKAAFLKAGACASKKFTVKSDIRYSKLKGETAGPNPAKNLVNTVSACTA